MRGRLTKETRCVAGSGGGTFITEYSYDAADLLRTVKYPDGETVTTGYLPQMLVDSVSGSGTYVQQTQYDASGQVELRKLSADQVRTRYERQLRSLWMVAQSVPGIGGQTVALRDGSTLRWLHGGHSSLGSGYAWARRCWRPIPQTVSPPTSATLRLASSATPGRSPPTTPHPHRRNIQ